MSPTFGTRAHGTAVEVGTVLASETRRFGLKAIEKRPPCILGGLSRSGAFDQPNSLLVIQESQGSALRQPNALSLHLGVRILFSLTDRFPSDFLKEA